MQAAGDKYYISTLEGLGEGEALHGVTKGRKGPFFKDNVILAHSDIMWELGEDISKPGFTVNPRDNDFSHSFLPE